METSDNTDTNNDSNDNEVHVESVKSIRSLSELNIKSSDSFGNTNGVHDDDDDDDYGTDDDYDTDDSEDDELEDSSGINHEHQEQLEQFREALREERHLHHETTKKLQELRATNHEIAIELKEDREEIQYLKETMKKLLAESKGRDALLKAKVEAREKMEAKEKEAENATTSIDIEKTPASKKTPSSIKKKFKHQPEASPATAAELTKHIEELQSLHAEIDALRHENLELRETNKKVTRQFQDNLLSAKKKATKHLLERWRSTILRWRSAALIRTMALWKSQTKKKRHEFQLKSQKERLKKEHEAELHEQEEKHHTTSRSLSRQNSNKFSTEYLSALGVELSMDGDLDPETEAEMQKKGITHLLRGIPLFHSLPADKLNALKGSLTERHCVDDEVIVKKGDYTKYCYVIVSGHVESYSDLDHTGHLSPGDIFLTHELMGETAIDRVVNSTYYAVGDIFLLACNKHTFESAVGTIDVEQSVKIEDKAGRSLEGYTHCLRLILHPDADTSHEVHRSGTPGRRSMSKKRRKSGIRRESCSTGLMGTLEMSILRSSGALEMIESDKEAKNSPVIFAAKTAILDAMAAFAPSDLVSLSDIFERLVKAIYQSIPAEKTSIFYCDWENEQNILIAAKYPKDRGLCIPIKAGISGYVATEGETVNLADVYEDDRFGGKDWDKKVGQRTKQMLCVPIFTTTKQSQVESFATVMEDPDGEKGENGEAVNGEKNRVFAVIQLTNNTNDTPFRAQDEIMLQTYAKLMSPLLTEVIKRGNGTTKSTGTFDNSISLTWEQSFTRYKEADDVDDKLSFQILDLIDLPLKRKRNKVGITKPQKIFIQAELRFANTCLHKKEGPLKCQPITVTVRSAEEYMGFEFDNSNQNAIKFDFPVLVSDVPRNAYIRLQVIKKKKKKDDQVIANVDFPVFDFNKAMFGSGVVLDLSLGAPDAETFAGTYGKAARDCPKMTITNNNLEDSRDVIKYTEASFDILAFSKAFMEKQKQGLMRTNTKAITTESEIKQILKCCSIIAPMDTLLRKKVWKYRYELMRHPEALPVFVRSINWNEGVDVTEAQQLLNTWAPPSVTDALQLLSPSVADAKIRSFAVQCLETCSNKELEMYMLQLVQAIKHEPFCDSSLVRFIVRRGLRVPETVGHALFWALEAELGEARASKEKRENQRLWSTIYKFGVALTLFLRTCGAHRVKLGHEMYMMQCLKAVQEAGFKAKNKQMRLQAIKNKLKQLHLPDRFQLPLDASMRASGLNVEKCRPMSSKMVPLWLNFKNPIGDQIPHVVLFKAGDDLRQDQLTLQLFRILDHFWKNDPHSKLDLCMSAYNVIPTGRKLGMIEIVQNANTVANIIADSVSSMTTTFGKAYSASFHHENAILEWLEQNCMKSEELKAEVLKQKGESGEWNMKNALEKAIDNFIRSCAGYCVGTYILGIGDRHPSNLMVTTSGKFLHIDFGHFLGNFKTKLGFKRETAPFVFTKQMRAVFGGKNKDPAGFIKFKSYSATAYNIARKNGNHLIALMSLMISCGIPELQESKDIEWLEGHLMLIKDASKGELYSDDEAAKDFQAQIEASLKCERTEFNNFCHLVKHS